MEKPVGEEEGCRMEDFDQIMSFAQQVAFVEDMATNVEVADSIVDDYARRVVVANEMQIAALTRVISRHRPELARSWVQRLKAKASGG